MLDAFLHYNLQTCVFTSSELPDIEFIYSKYFNKIEVNRFNSTVGKFVGYTEFGIYNAELFNNDPAVLARWRAQKERVCKPNIEIEYRKTLDKTAEPSVRLTSVTPPGGRHPAMLMCSVYNFYPKYISVTWLRDGQPVTSDVTSTDELANGDWYYQIHSYLEYTPRSGEKITCMVEHASFPSPKKVDWNPSMPQSDRNKIAIGASGLLLGLIFVSLSVPDAFLRYCLDTCVFTSSELPEIEYIGSQYFNKIEDIRFNSTVGKWVGYTDHGIRNAELWNNDPTEMAHMRAQKERYCKPNIETWFQDVLDKTAEPSVSMTSVRPHSGRHPAMLMCSVYNFYPKYISVTWLRDGQPVTSDVTSTDELANGDWYYQIHSHLEYTPRSGEKITCMVEHASFPSPKKVDWNPSMSQSDRNKIATGASGLLLGWILSLAGLIYYKRKARGRVLVPTS
ncbi:uncharacterized protein LOC130127228 [Lampris incognitus]|uniref:uncharacterized protein LOC130127228 n=1 Tax=Lampris incognitus TaxID=2546036 RepID=UPI0024B4D1C2|nr:uncharacterized protein LOC130127228 [Lampris incognitus]